MAELTEEQLAQRLNDIPPLPAAVADILEALNHEDLAIELLENKISNDPSISARVLSIANSPFYGNSRSITSIRQACMILGVSTLKHVALTAVVFSNFPPNSGNQINNMDIWRHAMGTATASKVIAGRIGADKEIAFTAGLLHDVGRMVLDHCFPEEYAQVIAYQADNDVHLCKAEMAILGITHCTAGEIMAKRWHFPDIITTIIRNHHALPQADDDIQVEIIRAGNAICSSLELGRDDNSLLQEVAESTLRHLSMDIPALMACRAEVVELNNSTDWLF